MKDERKEFWEVIYRCTILAGYSWVIATRYADEALAAYDERFPQPKPPAIEEPVKLNHTCGICLASYDACNCKELGYR